MEKFGKQSKLLGIHVAVVDLEEKEACYLVALQLMPPAAYACIARAQYLAKFHAWDIDLRIGDSPSY